MAILEQAPPKPAISETAVNPAAVGRAAGKAAGQAASWTARATGGIVFFVIVAAFFLISGASGLIYQVAWVRILSLTFGVTIYAVSTVLCGFMLGLALGSYLAGRISSRVKDAVFAYGLVECGIGLSALFTPAAFGWLRDSYPAIYRWSEGVGAALATSPGGIDNPLAGAPIWLPGLVRLLLAFAILLVPTTLMGATLPIVLKSTLLSGSGLGRNVSLLYAINTMGAILGTVAAGYWLIAEVGVLASIQTAAALNITVGIGAIVVSVLMNVVSAGRGVAINQTVVFVAFGLSGLFALGYEVIWFRLLGLFFENITYAFTIMLASVLFGIAFGSYVLSPILGLFGRWLNGWIVFGILEIGIGITALLSITVLSRIDEFVALLAAWEPLAFILTLEDSRMILAAGAAIVPAMFLSGMTFPVAAAIYAKDAEHPARRVGSLYAANLVGSILGSAIGGFVLIPTLASQRSLVLLAAGSAICGVLVLWAAPRRRWLWILQGALTLGSVWLFVQSSELTPDLKEKLLAARFPGKEILWYKEGLENSVTIVKEDDGHITLYSNSRGQARDEEGLVTFHRLLGHFPMLVHPNPKRAAIVGIGGGATAGVVSQYPGVHVDAIELSDAVIEAQHFFSHVNYRFFELPNVTVYNNDARNHLLVTGKKYSVISGDAIRPNDAGSVTLYSVDYYRIAANALEDDGLMTQWLPPFSDHQYKLIMRTFLAAFPHVTLWQSGDLLIGSKQPISISRAHLAARWSDLHLRVTLAESGITSPNDFLSRFNASTDELRARVGEGPIITDDRPYIEFFRNLPQDDPPNVFNYSRDNRSIVRP